MTKRFVVEFEFDIPRQTYEFDVESPVEALAEAWKMVPKELMAHAELRWTTIRDGVKKVPESAAHPPNCPCRRCSPPSVSRSLSGSS